MFATKEETVNADCFFFDFGFVWLCAICSQQVSEGLDPVFDQLIAEGWVIPKQGGNGEAPDKFDRQADCFRAPGLIKQALKKLCQDAIAVRDGALFSQPQSAPKRWVRAGGNPEFQFGDKGRVGVSIGQCPYGSCQWVGYIFELFSFAPDRVLIEFNQPADRHGQQIGVCWEMVQKRTTTDASAFLNFQGCCFGKAQFDEHFDSSAQNYGAGCLASFLLKRSPGSDLVVSVGLNDQAFVILLGG
jgi:hypothetical protein